MFIKFKIIGHVLAAMYFVSPNMFTMGSEGLKLNIMILQI